METTSRQKTDVLDGAAVKNDSGVLGSGNFQRIVFPLAFFLCAALIMTWPLASDMSHSVVGSRGDNIYYIWLIGWFQKAIFQLHVNPLVVTLLNYPAGWPLAYTEITFANIVIALPFSLVWGPVLAYNMVLLISFVLSGWFMFLWVDEITKNRLAGLVAGTVFAFAPYRMAHLNGHLPLMGTQWLVLFFFGLYMLLYRKDWEWRYILITGLGFGLASLSSMYYLYMTIIITIVALAAFLIVERRSALNVVLWKKLLATCLTTAPLLVAAIYPYLSIASQGNANHRPFEGVDLWSASIANFLLPAPTHFLWGQLFMSGAYTPVWVEFYLYLGAVSLLLVVIALWPEKENRGETFRKRIWMIAIILSSIVLAMGTTLHWNNDPVVVNPIPSIFRHIPLFVFKQGIIPLPNYLLFKYLPFYDGMRVWSRYGIFAILFIAVLAGIGFDRIAKRISRRTWKYALSLAAIFLVCIDFRVQVDLTRVEARPVDVWLQSAEGAGSVVEFPIDESITVDYVYGSLIHQKPLLGMFYGAYLPQDYESLLPTLNTFPSEDSVRVLRERGVGYVLVDQSQYPDWPRQEKLVTDLGLVYQTQVDQFMIYHLSPAE
jgi:hypothetical protein